MSDGNKELVRKYYSDLWNKWDPQAAAEIISEDVSFHGSLGLTVKGRDGFQGYVDLVRSAFPDFHNRVDDLIAEGDKVVARLTYTGTHRGALFGIEPTGNKVSYGGVAIFRIAHGQIVDGWVQGDTLGLLRQLGASTLPGASV